MSEIKKNKIYQDLPLIYDHLMRKIRYDYWADYLFHITSKYASKKADVLELAAGNCSLAKYLIKKYPNLIASDLSMKMLANSKDKTIKRVCCNMISIPFKNHFNLIYSTFDSINYILAKKKLLYFLNGINESLSNNGIFTFDVSLEKNSIEHVSQPVRSSKYMGYNYIHKSTYNEKSRIHKNIFQYNITGWKSIKRNS